MIDLCIVKYAHNFVHSPQIQIHVLGGCLSTIVLSVTGPYHHNKVLHFEFSAGTCDLVVCYLLHTWNAIPGMPPGNNIP